MSKTEILQENIRRLSGRQYRWLTFPPSMEQRFASDGHPFRSMRQWLEGLIGIILYAALALFSQLEGIQPTKLSWELRCFLVVPLALLVNTSMLFPALSWLQETGIVVASCTAGSVEVLLYFESPGNEVACAQLAIVAVFVFTNTVMRLRWPFAATTFAWGLGAECVLFSRSHANSQSAVGLTSVVVLAIAIFTLLANYSQGREARLAFLKHAAKQELVSTLTESNENLAVTALTDPLTLLPNRNALQAHLAIIWSEAVKRKSACSVIVVDIDHFKAINDRHGHLYGDRVLKRVATLMAEALRGEKDFLARFGGEEFIVILPNTADHQVHLVAERLRDVVELAGLPAVREGDPSVQGLRVTISCGVATITPGNGADPNDLIGTADEALYRAKRDGRNRVCGCTVCQMEEVNTSPAKRPLDSETAQEA